MNLFRKLLMESQFHGTRRLSERKYRACWAVALALCFWLSSSIIAITTSRFFANPTYVAKVETSNMSIKFPSVIVCPEVWYPDYKIDEFLASLSYPPNMTSSVIRPIIRQLAAFYTPNVKFKTEDLKTIELLLKFNLIDVETATRRLTVTCEETILRCRLFGKMVNCTSLFKLELANFGYCCVFQGRSLQREIRTNGIQKAVPPPALYTTDSEHGSGLMIVVNSSQKTSDIDLTYKSIYLNPGQYFIEAGDNGTSISPNYEYWVGYSSHDFLLDENVRSLSRELRRCRMSTEQLRFFPKYSKRLCIMECEMMRTLRRCYCVKLTHPRPPSWKTCQAEDLLCMKNSAVPYDSNVCDCPLTCDSTTDIITSVSRFRLIPGSHSIDHMYHGLNFSQVTVVRAFIKRHSTKQLYARRSFFSAINLFSQIGGTLNVFFGCSILSVVELIQLAWHGYRQYKVVKTQGLKPRSDHRPSGGTEKNNKKKTVKGKKTVKFYSESK